MTGIFRTNNPLNSFLLFLYGLLLKFIWLLHPQVPMVQKPNGFLFNEVINLMKPYLELYPSSYFFIPYLLIFTQAISFNQLIMRRRMMQKPNYLPAMSYLLLTSFFSEWNVLSAPMIINTLLIWVWARMSSLNTNQHPKSTLFNAGIIIGICAFLFVPSFVFALFIIFSLIISRSPKPAEMFINLIGIVTPWYFLASWLFLTNKIYSFSLSGTGVTSLPFQPESITVVALLLLLLLTIAGVFIVQSLLSKQIIQVRKNWRLMLLYLAIAVAALFIGNIYHIEYWLLALVPVSVFVGYVFYFIQAKWLSSLLHWLMVAFVLYNQYFHK